VAAPITVEGRLWGVVVAASRQPQQLPPGSESRIAEFTELLATAIANAQAREELRCIADEQAALRRVATLVARSRPPAEVFSAVAKEMRDLLGTDITVIMRFEPDATVILLAGAGARAPLGSRWKLQPPLAAEAVYRTGRCARVDDYSHASGEALDLFHRERFRSTAASPIIVGGRLWGAIAASSRGEPLAADTEQRMVDFTELVATAIANAENRAELTASRARIVAASDETRRRLERDLHDGVQQRLVSLVLTLRGREKCVPSELPEVQGMLTQTADELTGVLTELQEISRGIHPAILSQGGLAAALKTLARRSATPVELSMRAQRQLSERVEVAAYYIIAEALANIAKHAHASAAHLDVDADATTLRLWARDNGVGGADPRRGSGLIGLTDRVEALGGTIEIESPPGKGTTLHVTLPITAP
jgi:signal transduction histidine kinase